jgi:hypothetical protein
MRRNVMEELLRQSVDVVNIALAVGTWALVGVSAYFMRRSANHIADSNKINREANELAKTELKSRLKPELDFLELRGDLKSKPDQYAMRILGKIKNRGTVPASNIRASFIETSKEYLRDLLKEKENISMSKFFATLTPGSESEFLFPMPWAQDKSESKLLVWVDYEYEDVAPEKGEKAFLLSVSGASEVKIKLQFVKSDIERGGRKVHLPECKG